MKRKVILISIAIIVLAASIYLYQTYAITPIELNNSYSITLTGNTTVNVPANSSKNVIYQIKNTTGGTVKYGVGYHTDNSNISVQVYYNSYDNVEGIIENNNYKHIKLKITNTSETYSSVDLLTILGYENGGELIIPDGVTKVTEIVY